MNNKTFRDREKERYKRLKAGLFSSAAQKDGTYRGRSRNFCLADDRSAENLHITIREPAIEYFKVRNIPWHDGLKGRRLPSNHLCCSQSCCINFLFPMATDSELIANVFRCFYPDLVEPLPIDKDLPLSGGFFPYMTFEWIGSKNADGKYIDYLTEHRNKRGQPTRGANYTSADFTFRFARRDGKTHLVLGEWKYTEYYGSKDLGTPTDTDRKPEVRKRTYWPSFNRENGVFKVREENLYSALFFEPFYQLMRLQLLAQEMELNHEMGADIVSVLHISPQVNREFRDIINSPGLANRFLNKGVMEVWRGLVSEDKFMSISVEDVLNGIVHAGAGEQDWIAYLVKRYGWDRNT